MKPSPRKGKRYAQPTATRSLRLPVAVWEALDELAEDQVDSRNSVVLQGLLHWLEVNNVKIEVAK